MINCKVLRLLEQRERIGHELHTSAIHRMMAVTLNLEATRRRSHDDVVTRRIRQAVKDLDETFGAIRATVFEEEPFGKPKADTITAKRFLWSLEDVLAGGEGSDSGITRRRESPSSEFSSPRSGINAEIPDRPVTVTELRSSLDDLGDRASPLGCRSERGSMIPRGSQNLSLAVSDRIPG